MSDPILFLDIDGVLNGNEFDPEVGSNTIRRDCVRSLNRVLRQTDCKIVLSSAWRYMVLNGAMTLRGFGYMLGTHGVEARGRVIGTTAEGEEAGATNSRGDLIHDWLYANPHGSYAVVDDLEIAGGHPFVRTDGKRGMTDEDAAALIDLLNRRTP